MSATAKTWSVAYRVPGANMQRLTIGRYPQISIAQARARAAEVTVAKSRGLDPARDKREIVDQGRLTFDKLADDFLSIYAVRKAPKTASEYRYALKLARDHFGSKSPVSIRREDIGNLLDDIAKRAPVLSNRVRATLSKTFAWALERGDVKENPTIGVSKRVKEVAKERVLSETEIALLLETLSDVVCPCEDGTSVALRLILATAARPSEVTGMRWSELDLEDDLPFWRLPAARAKGGKVRIIPLSRWALTLLSEAREAGSKREHGKDYVFPARYTSEALAAPALSRALPEVLAIYSLEHCTPHDLRRTAATWSRNMGASLDGVIQLLGHSRAGVTAIYDRSTHDAEARRAVDLIAEGADRVLARLLAKRKAKWAADAAAAKAPRTRSKGAAGVGG
jgi:integrase